MNSFTITIDIGNSNTKCALFNNTARNIENELLCSFNYDHFKTIQKEYALEAKNTEIIFATVTEKKIDLPFKTLNVISLFKTTTFLEMPVHYNESVGIDRLVTAYYAYNLDLKPKIIIDTGTFTTVDFVDIKGFNGGYILPGLGTLAQSYLKGEHLFKPALDSAKSLSELLTQIPQTTEKAIKHGALLSFLAPVEKLISLYPTSNILITGGNGLMLKEFIQNQLSMHDQTIQFEANLIHKGLSLIQQNEI